MDARGKRRFWALPCAVALALMEVRATADEVAPPGPAVAPEAPPPDERVTIRARAGATFGGARFELNFPVEGGISGRSRLDWPLSGVLVGADVSVGGRALGYRRWELTARLAGTVSSPFTTMVDRDWLLATFDSLEFSHTDSRVQGGVVIGDLSLAYGPRRDRGNRMIELDVVVGLAYEHYELSAWGVTGWQLTSGLAPVPVSAPDNLQLATLTGNHFLPHLGFQLRARAGRFRVDLGVSPAVAIALQEDRHVYRRKLGTATSYGVGVLLHLRPRLLLTRPSARGPRLALGIDAEARALEAFGKLQQHYYGDDPDLPGNQTGMQLGAQDFITEGVLGTIAAVFEVVL